MKKTLKPINIPLLGKIVIAIILGIALSYVFPVSIVRIFVTFNGLFSGFLGFILPFLIVALVAPGIFEIKSKAGSLLLITAAIAYLSTWLAGTLSYFTCELTYPSILAYGGQSVDGMEQSSQLYAEYVKIPIPPVMDITSSLVLAFVLGLCLSRIKGDYCRNVLYEFREVIMMIISKVIIPLLPLFIFGIFLKIADDGQAASTITLFLKVIVVIFILHIFWLVLQYCVAGAIARKNPFKALLTMLPAYVTALGTQSSAATIPVTLQRAKANGIKDTVADFVIPLCATIHLSGSCLKIVACAFAVLYMQGVTLPFTDFLIFICMLSVTMVAAPGVPGGAIMAALGPLSEYLGFTPPMQALMIALYIAMDSFGTACNVTGDGAIAMIINKLNKDN